MTQFFKWLQALIIRRRVFLLVFAVTATGLLTGEIIVRKSNVDWRYAKKSLYYQERNLVAHRPVDDPVLLYGLKPGSYRFNNFKRGNQNQLTINSLGFRGPEYSVQKPPGVFRIICVGGSNPYGMGVNDEDTWPARLEQRLNATHASRFEVWNLGVPAYVGVQMAKAAEIARQKYDPDIIIIALSNRGMRAMLARHPVGPLFEKYPQLWFELVIPPDFSILPAAIDKLAVKHVRIYRQILLAMTEKFGRRSWYLPHHEQNNLRAVREFLINNESQCKLGVYICPAYPMGDDYFQGIDIPVFVLHPKESNDLAFKEIHPSPQVLTWYAQKLAEWLERDFTLPE